MRSNLATIVFEKFYFGDRVHRIRIDRVVRTGKRVDGQKRIKIDCCPFLSQSLCSGNSLRKKERGGLGLGETGAREEKRPNPFSITLLFLLALAD